LIGPCTKRTVVATIIALDGRRFVGTNYVRNAQPVCPRADMATGVGYELCRDVCDQSGHAEPNAIAAAGDAARGGTLYLEGHTYACEPCKAACATAGIVEIIIGNPPVAN
jgi:deoxycytidylate deaminase